MLSKEKQEEIEQKRQRFRDEHIAFQFFYLLYQFGFLDLLKSKTEVKALLAGRTKTVPYNVHHIRPLSLNGNNDFLNLSLIDEKLHNFIHKYCIPHSILKRMDSKRDSQKEKLIKRFIPKLGPIARMEDFFKECIVYAIRATVYATPIKKLKKSRRPLVVKDIREAFSSDILQKYSFSPQAFYRLQDLHVRFRLAPEKARTKAMEDKIVAAEKKFIGRTVEEDFLVNEMREKWARMNTIENVANYFTQIVLIHWGVLPKNVLTEEDEQKAVVTVMRANQTTAISKAKKRGGKGIVDD